MELVSFRTIEIRCELFRASALTNCLLHSSWGVAPGFYISCPIALLKTEAHAGTQSPELSMTWTWTFITARLKS